MGISGGYGQVYEVPFVALARLSGLNIFLHHHSYAYLRTPNSITRTLFRMAGRKAFHIALCDDMEKRLKSSYETVKRTGVVSNAVFIDQYEQLSSRKGKTLATIGFLGNISYEKGIMEFFDVVARLEREGLGINAVIAGPFQDEEIETKVRERLSKQKTAKYVGPKYAEEKKSFYNSIDVLLFPTKYVNEAEPLTIHEALTSGVPVIARSMGCISSMVSSGAGLVVDTIEEYPEKAFQQLMAWYSSPDVFREATRKARESFLFMRDVYTKQLQILCSTIAFGADNQEVPELKEGCSPSHEKIRCLLCEGETSLQETALFDTRFGISSEYNTMYCPSCNLEQLSPLPQPEELKKIYEKYYNFEGERGTWYVRLREKFLASFLYRVFLRFDGDISFHTRRGPGRLLDIGCNEGRGLTIYHNNGFIAEGLELNEEAASAARCQGFTIYTELLERFQPADAYDIAILSNVLEHSLNPKEMLFHTRRILKPGGKLWVSCPNSKSWLRFLFGKYWINWHVPFHIVHFSTENLKKILTDNGFDAVELRQETPALWAAQSIIAGLFAKRGKPTRQLRNPFLILALMTLCRGLLFPLLWLGNRLGRGDCLVVTARKRE